jgi:hypothetical protein
MGLCNGGVVVRGGVYWLKQNSMILGFGETLPLSFRFEMQATLTIVYFLM